MNTSLPAADNALPAGTRLGELEILRVLGVGGFGIVYLARDHSLERDVALKEYMPVSLASRGAEGQITVRSSHFADTYALGLRSFVNEARLLARFDHPSLVKVYRFWEDKGTAYMVMPFLQGTSLRDVRRAMKEPPDEAWIRGVLEPVLAAVELLHREGVFHRDIAPDNVIITPAGLPVLLDFGAARRAIGDRTQTFTAILKPSYAPIEQYAEMATLRQGPWTDIYAIGALTHFLLFGQPPSPATARAVHDDLAELAQKDPPGVTARFMATLAWTLAVKPADRPQDAATLRAALDGRIEPPVPVLRVVPGDEPTVLIPTLGKFEPTVMQDRPPSLPPERAPILPPEPPRSVAPERPPTLPPEPSTSLPPRRAPITAAPEPMSAPAPMFAAEPAAVFAAPPAPARRMPWTTLGLATIVAAAAIGWFATQNGPAEAPSTARPPASAPKVAVPTPAPPASAPVVAAVPAGPAGPPPSAPAPPPTTVARENDGDGALSPIAPTTAARPPRSDGALRPRRVEEAMAGVPDDAPIAEPAADDRPGAAGALPPRERSVREVCGRRVLIALERCLERECRRPVHRGDPDCLWHFEQRRQRANPDP